MSCCQPRGRPEPRHQIITPSRGLSDDVPPIVLQEFEGGQQDATNNRMSHSIQKLRESDKPPILSVENPSKKAADVLYTVKPPSVEQMFDHKFIRQETVQPLTLSAELDLRKAKVLLRQIQIRQDELLPLKREVADAQAALEALQREADNIRPNVKKLESVIDEGTRQWYECIVEGGQTAYKVENVTDYSKSGRSGSHPNMARGDDFYRSEPPVQQGEYMEGTLHYTYQFERKPANDTRRYVKVSDDDYFQAKALEGAVFSKEKHLWLKLDTNMANTNARETKYSFWGAVDPNDPFLFKILEFYDDVNPPTRRVFLETFADIGDVYVMNNDEYTIVDTTSEGVKFDKRVRRASFDDDFMWLARLKTAPFVPMWIPFMANGQQVFEVATINPPEEKKYGTFHRRRDKKKEVTNQALWKKDEAAAAARAAFIDHMWKTHGMKLQINEEYNGSAEQYAGKGYVELFVPTSESEHPKVKDILGKLLDNHEEGHQRLVDDGVQLIVKKDVYDSLLKRPNLED